MAALKIGDILSGAVLAGLGVFIIAESRGWEYLGADGPGPGFLPIWYGIAMVALSLVLIATSLKQAAAGAAPAKGREIGRALATWLALVACVALLKVLGFLLAFALFTGFVVAVMYRKPVATALAVAVGSALGFYLIFPLALNVALPVGWLGF